MIARLWRRLVRPAAVPVPAVDTFARRLICAHCDHLIHPGVFPVQRGLCDPCLSVHLARS